MIYVDTSAVVKIFIDEPGRRELIAVLAERTAETLVTSRVTEVELARTFVRLGRPGWNVVAALDRFAIVDLHANIVRHAGTFPEPHLRALDAIHLATAFVAMIRTFVTYDLRQAEVARTLGMEVLSPGQ